ncbi:hypothetical protein ACT7DJ_28415 [Bacillus cereus]
MSEVIEVGDTVEEQLGNSGVLGKVESIDFINRDGTPDEHDSVTCFWEDSKDSTWIFRKDISLYTKGGNL